MSFLLLKSRRNRQQPPPPVIGGNRNQNRSILRNMGGKNSNGNQMQHRRTTMGNNQQQSSSTRILTNGGGQMQQQIQRQQQRPTTAANGGGVLLQKRQATKQQQQPPQQQHVLQGIIGGISMDEVMKDLELLKKQQIDAHNRLVMTKETKQKKLKQRTILENQYADLKYKNGEMRTQLQQYRQILSTCTHELGTSKLKSDSSEKELKSYDGRLRKAIELERTIETYRRNICFDLSNLRSKEKILMQLNNKLDEDVVTAETKLNNTKHREALLRKSIQTHKIQAKSLIESTTRINADIIRIEKDISSMQHMLQTTLERHSTLERESTELDNTHSNNTVKFQKKLDDQIAKTSDIEKHIQSLQGQYDTKKKELDDLFVQLSMQCSNFQKHTNECQNDGCDTTAVTEEVPFSNNVKNKNDSSTDDTKKLSLDIEAIRKSLLNEENDLQNNIQPEDLLQSSINSLTEQLLAEKKEESNLLGVLQDLQALCKEKQISHDERKKRNDELMESLQAKRNAVQDLRGRHKQLQDELNHLNSNLVSYESKVSQKDDLEQQIGNAKHELIQMEEEHNKMESSYEEANSLYKQQLMDARKKEQSLKQLYNKKHEELQQFVQKLDDDNSAKLAKAKEEADLYVDQQKIKLRKMIEENPRFEQLKISADATKTEDQMIKEALAEYETECINKIKHVTDEYNRRLGLVIRRQREESEQRRRQEAEQEAKKQAALEAARRQEEEAAKKKQEEKRRLRQEEELRRKQAEKEAAEAEATRKKERKRERQKRREEEKKAKMAEAERKDDGEEKAKKNQLIQGRKTQRDEGRTAKRTAVGSSFPPSDDDKSNDDGNHFDDYSTTSKTQPRSSGKSRRHSYTSSSTRGKNCTLDKKQRSTSLSSLGRAHRPEKKMKGDNDRVSSDILEELPQTSGDVDNIASSQKRVRWEGVDEGDNDYALQQVNNGDTINYTMTCDIAEASADDQDVKRVLTQLSPPEKKNNSGRTSKHARSISNDRTAKLVAKKHEKGTVKSKSDVHATSDHSLWQKPSASQHQLGSRKNEKPRKAAKEDRHKSQKSRDARSSGSVRHKIASSTSLERGRGIKPQKKRDDKGAASSIKGCDPKKKVLSTSVSSAKKHNSSKKDKGKLLQSVSGTKRQRDNSSSSQASGIATMERPSGKFKSRRKKNPSAKPKARLGGGFSDDYGFL